jgi:hippurate hydrolase
MRLLISSLLVAVLVNAVAVHAEEPTVWLKQQTPELVSLYKDFHEHPELSFREVETSEKVAAELKKVGCEVTTKVGRLGVVGLLKNGDGPVVMVRSDLDALPVTEETGLPYASKSKSKNDAGLAVGVMHACGHDMHMTCLIGTARYLAAHKDLWRGTVMFIGQPAEETSGGAEAMIKDGLFHRFPKPKFALALHVDALLAAGKIGYRGGYMLANVDSVDITLHGKGGHGAYPQTTIDPIVQAAHLVIDLQTLISRENSPFDPAVITVGSIHGGTKHNIIGDSCKLQITVRSYTEQVRQKLLDGIRRKAKAAAVSAGAPEPDVKVFDFTPALRNDEKLVEMLLPTLRHALGDEQVVPVEQSMGGEDFSQYGLAGVPVCMFRVGSVNEDRLQKMRATGQRIPSLHSSKYYPDPELTLQTGVHAMTAAVIKLMPAKNN